MKQPNTKYHKAMAYFKKLGWVGFFFFLGKGLLWLIVPYLVASGLLNCDGNTPNKLGVFLL